MKGITAVIFSLFLGVSFGVVGFLIFKSIHDRKLPVAVFVDEVRHIVSPRIRFGFLPYWLIDQVSGESVKSMTHLAYFGLVIAPDGSIQTMVNPREEEPGWTTLRSRKLSDVLQHARDSKKILSLVVHLARDDAITGLLSDPILTAKNLITDVTPVMKEYGYTDLNLDIESFRKASPEAQLRFTEFVKTVKEGVDENGLGTLSIDVLPRSFITDFILEPETIEPYADHIIIMAYDYHYSGSQYSGPVAPIGGAPAEWSLDIPVTVGEAVRVIPKEKLVIGFPLYGYEWESLSPTCPGPVIPGTGKTASAKRAAEIISACPECAVSEDTAGKSSCIIKPWNEADYYSHIFSENADSLQSKLDFVRDNGLAGSAFWALGYETEAMINMLKNY